MFELYDFFEVFSQFILFIYYMKEGVRLILACIHSKITKKGISIRSIFYVRVNM